MKITTTCWSILLVFFAVNPLFSQWQSMDGPAAGNVSGVHGNEQYLFACNATGLYRSNNGGVSWTPVDLGLAGQGVQCQKVKTHGPVVVVSTSKEEDYFQSPELLLSTDNGSHWQRLPLPYGDLYYMNFLPLQDKTLLVLGNSNWEVAHGQVNWRPIPGLNGLGLTDLFQNNGKIWAAGWNKIAYSTDNGQQWTVCANSAGQGLVNQIWGNGDTITISREVNTGGSYKIHTRYSLNNGQTWTNPLTTNGLELIELVAFKGKWFACTFYNIFTSSNGLDWENVYSIRPLYYENLFILPQGLFLRPQYTGLKRCTSADTPIFEDAAAGIKGAGVKHIHANDTLVLASVGEGGVYKWLNATEQWTPNSIVPVTPGPLGVIGAANDRFLVAQGDWVFYSQLDNAFWVSDPTGTIWQNAIIDEDNFSVMEIEKIRCALGRCVAIGDDGVLYSEDNGHTWAVDNGASRQTDVFDGLFYTILWGQPGLFVSFDAKDWHPLDTIGLLGNERMVDFSIIGENLLLVTEPDDLPSWQYRLYYSNDKGVSWQFRGLIEADVPSFGTIDAFPIFGNDDILFIEDGRYSSDLGKIWLPVPKNYTRMTVLGTNKQSFFGRPYFDATGLFQLPFDAIHFKPLTITAFHDLNENGQMDAGESPAEGVQIHIPSTTDLLVTDTTGTVQPSLNIAPNATDTLYINYAPSYATRPLYAKIPVTHDDSLVYVPISRTVNANVSDLGVFMGQTRPYLTGHESAAVLVAKNTGGTTSQGTTTLQLLPPPLAQTITYNPSPDVVSGDTLRWQVPVLQPDSFFVVKMAFATDPNLTPDTRVRFYAQIIPPANDQTAHNNQALLEIRPSWVEENHWTFANNDTVAIQQVKNGTSGLTVCSGYENTYSWANDPIEYAMFSSAPYIDVNVSSIRVVAASHPVTQTQRWDKNITLRLHTVDLADTTQGEASRCWVLYEIQPSTSLQTGDIASLSNHFNYNISNGVVSSPNTSVVRVSDGLNGTAPLPKPPVAALLNIQPNPSQAGFWLEPSGTFPASATLTLSDAAGRAVYQGPWNRGQSVQVPLAPGVYWVRLESAGQVQMGRVVRY